MVSLLRQMQTLQQRVNADVSKRKEAVNTLAEFAHASALLGTVESGHDDLISNFYLKLSEILKQMSSLNNELASDENSLFEDALKDYNRIIQAVQVNFYLLLVVNFYTGSSSTSP